MSVYDDIINGNYNKKKRSIRDEIINGTYQQNQEELKKATDSLLDIKNKRDSTLQKVFSKKEDKNILPVVNTNAKKEEPIKKVAPTFDTKLPIEKNIERLTLESGNNLPSLRENENVIGKDIVKKDILPKVVTDEKLIRNFEPSDGKSAELFPTIISGINYLGQGIMKGAEGVFVDTPLLLAAGTKKLLGDEKGANALMEASNVSLTDMLINKASGNETNPYKNNNQNLFNQELDKNSMIKENNLGGKIVQGVGEMLPTIAIGGSLRGGRKARQIGSNILLGSKAFSGSTNEAYQESGDIGKSMLYGLGSAGTELLTEKISDGIPGLKSIDGTTKKEIVKNYLKSSVGEGIEEVASSLANPVLQTIYKGKDSLKQYEDKDYWKDVAESGIVGTATGAILDSPNTINSLRNSQNNLNNQTQSQKQIAPLPKLNKDNVNVIKEDVANKQNISQENINSGLDNYTTHEIDNFSGGKVKVAQNIQDIVNFVESAKNVPSNAKLYFGKIGNNIATKIKNSLGINVENYNISLKADSIRHILKHHSNKTEVLRGQVPVTTEDFKLIPNIISEYDTIKQSGVTEQNKPSITFEKQIGDNYYAVSYVSDKSNSLDIQTMYKTQQKKNSATVSDANIPKLTSETNSGTSSLDSNIAQFENSVKLPSVNNMQKNHNNMQGLDNSSFSLKQQQNEIIQNSNPIEDDYHTWIRKVEDIKTFEEALQDSDYKEYFEAGEDFDDSYTASMAQEALDSGEITVYSSYPIEQGIFVSPSRIEAESYSGNGKVYSKKVNLTDVAWIDPTQGQYAKVDIKISSAKDVNKVNLPSVDNSQSNIPTYKGTQKMMNPNEILNRNNNVNLPIEKNDLGYIPKDPTKESSYNEIAQILTETPTTKKETAKEKTKKLLTMARASILDKGSVFEDLSIKTKNRELMSKWDYMLTSEARGQSIIGNGHIEYDSKTKTTKTLSKSLVDIRQDIVNTGLMQEFSDYMYQRLNVDRMTLEARYGSENKPVYGENITAEISKKAIENYEQSHPEFIDWANDVYDYVKADRQLMIDNGVISQETANLWDEMYPNYIPIGRVAHNNKAIDVPLDTGRTGINAPIKKAKGGNSNILPLFDTLANKTLQIQKAVAKNNFGVELKNTLKSTVNTETTTVDGIINDIDNQETLLQNNKNTNPTFTVFENGEKVTYEITRDMYSALQPVSQDSLLSKTITPLNKASSLQRGILTEYNPLFMATNAIKDIQDVLMNSQHATKTYATMPEAYAQLLNKGYWYQEYMANGGDQTSYFKSENGTNKSPFQQKIPFTEKFLPTRWISNINNLIEQAPRLAEYIASRKSGASIETAMLDSARVTTNFKAGGDLTKFVNRNGGTFLNASVQGFNQQIRNIREANMQGLKGWGKLAIKAAIAGLAVDLLNKLIWNADDEYEELSDYVKQNYYIVGKKDDGTFIRIPKGRTLAVIQESFNQTINAVEGKEVDMDSMVDLFINNLAPNNPLENNVISPLTQAMSNKTWYGTDLVPTRLQDKPVSEQYDESTDEFSKWLGKKLNISPYKINYVLNQYSGGVGDIVLPMFTDKTTSGADSVLDYITAPARDKFTTNSTFNNKYVTNFFETKETAITNAKSSQATDDDILKSKYLNVKSSEINKLYQEKRVVQSDKSLTNSEKYEQVKKIQRQIDNLAKETLGEYENVIAKENYAKVSDIEYYKNNKNEWEKIDKKELEKINSLKMTNSEKNTYFIAKNEISLIKKDESLDSDTIKSKIGNIVISSKLSDEKMSYLYSRYYSSEKTLNNILNSEIPMKEFIKFNSQKFEAQYDKNGKEIANSRKNAVIKYVNNLKLSIPQKAILIKMEYGSYNTYDKQVIEYVNSKKLDILEKGSILKSVGINSSDKQLINYVNSLSLTIEEKTKILKDMGFTVRNGKVIA